MVNPPPQIPAGAPANPPAPLLGRTLAGKYSLESLLGEGAMGAVYKARQISLEKTIAIKVMHLDLVTDRTFAARFHREAKAASRLDHPNSIRILDFGEEPDGLLYIAMEFLDGRDLLSVIDHEFPIPARRIVAILGQVLSALSVAHEMGVIHRDLKPENIMILQRKVEEAGEEEGVKVCDFGIAKVAETGDTERTPAPSPSRAKRGRLTTAGLVVGTPEYMSPEQGRAEVLDARSDLYSVGVILYQLLTGRIPFDAPTALGIVVKHQHEEPIRPSLVRPGVDLRLEEVCLRAMRKRSSERYAGAREMRAALRAALDGTASTPVLRTTLPFPMAGKASFVEPEVTGPKETPTLSESSAPLVAAAAPAEPPARSARFVGKGLLAGLAMIALACGAWYVVRSPRPIPEPMVASAPETTPPSPAPLPPPPTPSLVPSAPPSAATPLSLAPSSPSSAVPPRSSPPRAIAPPSRARSKEKATSPSIASEPMLDPEPPPAPPSPVTAVVESLPPPLPPVASPAHPPFDPRRARVDLGSAQIVMGGARSSSVNRVLSGLHDKMSQCYQWSASASSPEGTWNLRLLTDDDGNINEVRLEGPLPNEVKACISSALRGGKLDADTGAVTADVKLTFRLR